MVTLQPVRIFRVQRLGAALLKLPHAPCACASKNRIGLNRSQSAFTFCVVIHSRINRAVNGASNIPLRKCPVAINNPSTSVDPRIGR